MSVKFCVDGNACTEKITRAINDSFLLHFTSFCWQNTENDFLRLHFAAKREILY